MKTTPKKYNYFGRQVNKTSIRLMLFTFSRKFKFEGFEEGRRAVIDLNNKIKNTHTTQSLTRQEQWMLKFLVDWWNLYEQ